MRIAGIFKQLKERRVMRAAVIYIALLLAAAVFAWQQSFVAFTRPTIAVLPIEATDTRLETKDLADHLTRRFRLLLAYRPELRVIELDSSMHASLDGLPVSARADALGAELVLAGTLSGRDQNLRLSVQLFAADGELIWSDGFEGPLLYQEQLQGWVLDDLWPQLPLNPEALEETHDLIASCAYPGDAVAILTLARVGRRGGDSASLAMVAASHEDAGLLHLAKSRFYFEQTGSLPPAQRPVIHSLAMQSLGLAERGCAGYPELELLRLVNTRELSLQNAEGYIARHPNSAALYLALAGLHHEAGALREVRALVNEAMLLDPLGTATKCRARELPGFADVDDGTCL